MAWRGLSILNVLKGGPKLTRQIAGALDMTPVNLRCCLRTLVARGLITSCEGCHQITEKGAKTLAEGREVTSGPTVDKAVTRRETTLRDKAWRAMRIREVFSLDELMMLICDGEEKDATGNLGGYIRALANAGYLVPMRRRAAGRNHARWRLTRKGNTGLEAPAWNKARGMVTDANTGEVFNVRPAIFETNAVGIVQDGKA